MSKQPRQTEPIAKRQLHNSAETIETFVRYLSSPWRIIWTNFVAGIFRGLGAMIGATVIIAGVIWLLSQFVKVPLIGKYAEKVEDKVTEYVDETNYKQDFDRLGDSLERIESALNTAPIVLPPGWSDARAPSENRAPPTPAGQPDQTQ